MNPPQVSSWKWKWKLLSGARLYSPWISPGQNTGVGSLSLLQGIFPTQGLNPGLLHFRWILYQLSHKGSPKILEWVAFPFSRGSSWPRSWTRVFHTCWWDLILFFKSPFDFIQKLLLQCLQHQLLQSHSFEQQLGMTTGKTEKQCALPRKSILEITKHGDRNTVLDQILN